MEAATAEEGLRSARTRELDLVLADVALPGMSGLALCRRLKDDPRTAKVPVVLMSEKAAEGAQRAHSVQAGAVAHLLKPFSPRLLLAKIRRALTPAPAAPQTAELRCDGLVVDPEAHTASAGGKALTLTRKEFDLLAAFLSRRGRLLSVPFLLETVWGGRPDACGSAHTLEVHISSLRRKLGPRAARRLVTVPGFGYRYEK